MAMTIAAPLALPHGRTTPRGPQLSEPSPSPRAAVPAFRVPPRIYSPYRPRRLVRPMAVPWTAGSRAGGPPGRLAGWLFRARRG